MNTRAGGHEVVINDPSMKPRLGALLVLGTHGFDNTTAFFTSPISFENTVVEMTGAGVEFVGAGSTAALEKNAAREECSICGYEWRDCGCSRRAC